MSREDTRQCVSIATDDRARIPFAMIAVLLLVASVGLVATLETRSDPTVDRDVDLAMDRTITATQGELRTATLAASERVGTAPITSYDDSEIDAIAHAADQEEAFETYLKLLVYLEAVDRVPNAGQSIGGDTLTGVSLDPVHSGDGDGLDPGEAIERVDLEVGHFDPQVETGTIVATVHEIKVTAMVEGEPVVTETRAMEVTVGSPVFELNDRMAEYETQLNAGFFEEGVDGNTLDGLGSHLAARLYPLAYFKSGWNRMQPTRSPHDHDFEQITDLNHTEVLANQAIFAVQEDTFGTSDPYAERTMRPGYICMGYEIGETLLRSDGEGGELIDEDEVGIGDGANETAESGIDVEEALCGDGVMQEWIFGDESTGELPDAPDLSDLVRDGLGAMDVMDGEETVRVDHLAEAAHLEYTAEEAMDVVGELEEMAEAELNLGEGDEATDELGDPTMPVGEESYDRSIGSIVEQVYRVNLDRSEDVDGPPMASTEFPSEYNRSNYTDPESTLRVTDVTVRSTSHDTNEAGDDYSRQLHEVELTATVETMKRTVWVANDENVSPQTVNDSDTRSGSIGVAIEVEGEYGFDRRGEHYDREEFAIEELPVHYDYERNEGSNFYKAFEAAIVEMTVADGVESVESDLADALESTTGLIASPTSYENRVENALFTDVDRKTVPYEALVGDEERERIRALTAYELDNTHETFLRAYEEDPFTVERIELTESPSPPTLAKEYIQDEFEDEFVYAGFEAARPNETELNDTVVEMSDSTDDASDSTDDVDFSATSGEPYGTDGVYDGYLTPYDKARVQVRKAYFDRVYYWLDALADPYEERIDDIEDEVDDLDGGAMDDVLGFAQDALNADLEYDPEPIDGSRVLDEAHFEVAGSPTYMVHGNISQEDDPAVRPGGDTITDIGGETEHVPLSIRSNNRVPWPGVPVIPYPPAMWLAQVNFWDVEIRGEYARFEVSSTVGDPSHGDRLTYVREDHPIDVEVHDGKAVYVGSNEAISFASQTEVVVMMPGQVVSTGSIPAVSDTEPDSRGGESCSPTWAHTGPDFDPADDLAADDCHYPGN